ncbi:MAG: PD40 domain-containing protein [Roseiflexaceae bacterium]|nr:PD40 domain-containing protein [Roseiflexaceae bacterium]
MPVRFIALSLLALALAACAAPNTITEPSIGPLSPMTPSAGAMAVAAVAPANTVAPTPNKRTTAVPAPTAQPGASTNEVLFLRKGMLTAYSSQTKAERVIAEGVREFTATPNGALLALVRGAGRQAEIWTVRRDGSELTRRTENTRVEALPALSADGSALVFASAEIGSDYVRAWPEWGAWCAASEVRLIELASGQARTLGTGCDPAIAPDGRRIAYASPPTSNKQGFPASSVNAIRLVNRQGQNGWNFAKADGTPARGMVVHAPAWSPDGAQVSFQRFVGYQALVDLATGEVAPAFKGGGMPFYSGAGWQLPAHQSGNRVAVIEDNYSDARGWGGYDAWSVTVVKMSGQRTVALPTGEVQMVGASAETLPRAQSGAWSPNGQQLAVILPPGWRADLPTNEPVNNGDSAPGELWLWQPGSAPSQRLAITVDFASPVGWLP